jgi:colanic acid/amylovoran biosynthesis glycosyltransferase
MRIAYIVTMFPCWSETFILNEIVNHTNAGLNISIFSLKQFSEKFVHENAAAFLSKTAYAPSPFSPILLLLHIGQFLKQPIRYLAVFAQIIKLRPFSSFLALKSLYVFWISPYFAARVNEFRIDHIHAHFATYAALLARILNEFTGVSYSFTAHAHDIYVDRTLLPIAAEKASAIVTISSFNKNLLEEQLGRRLADRIMVIRCGINVGQFAFSKKAVESPNKVLHILSVGRLSGIKGFPCLLEALAQLQQDGMRFSCKIIGDGPQLRLLQDLAKRLCIEPRVSFLGAIEQKEVRKEMENADVFVLACGRDASEGHDGIPVVFMEAMALGTPVIGTQLSGIPELVRHGETGLLAAPGDSKSLADTIRSFAGCFTAAESMCIRARQLIEEEFDIEINSRKLRRLFFAAVAIASASQGKADAASRRVGSLLLKLRGGTPRLP